MANLFLIPNVFYLIYPCLVKIYFTIMTLHSQLIFYGKYFCSYLMFLQYFKYECLTNKFIT